ncbi:Alpha/Beta hydrolase protein [Aspergillus californicus]
MYDSFFNGFQYSRVNIPQEEAERLKRKLKDTRLPGREIVPDAGNKYGPSYAWAADSLEKWKNDFDWIHFLHARAEKPDAIPLLLVHGWPGSFYEFSRLWGPLSHPENPNDQAFHVVVPSIPGFCWSDWPPRAGWTLQDTARIFDQLMKKLGYHEYMIQCGDWGHFSESTVAGRVDDWLENHLGYAICMRTRPHTIGIDLNDNPVGILMWVGEKYNEAADPQKQKLPSWSEAILTTASLYFFSDCTMPSMLCYYENVRHENFAMFTFDPSNQVQVPFSYSSFFWDTEPSSKRAVERTGNLVYYRENPDDIVQDLRELAEQEWKFELKEE